MRHEAPSTPGPPGSPILSIQRGHTRDIPTGLPTHSHPEPMLMSSAGATVLGSVGARDWLIPPGYGLWIPGGYEHGGAVLHHGELSILHLDTEHCPITWTEPTGVAVGPLLRELITHLLRIAPHDPSRRAGETLLFDLLTPLTTHDIQVAVPADPRVSVIAERLLAHPDDQRELTDWADEVHASVRTLSRLFPAETGLTFAAWRTQVRIHAAIQLLGRGTSVTATARAVGYRHPSAFITAFRRVTGHTPGTYNSADAVRP
ncbi:helix-turn-helix transcriptional regulator [Kineosporia mesophila]|uniref:Helix-turn-helix transcriptional regulator n=1 Tax=Kineosporia mesophila TaxID=566012 RepID=A0ABP7ACC9_9ACTN|nr:AraC family transcriptional regulator [Kineosporia mesophila]MCD5351264.1 AraC family transcriptional regulator [Kineosporia mesophila]